MNAWKQIVACAFLVTSLAFNLPGGTHAQDAKPPEYKVNPDFLVQQLFSISHSKVLMKELEIVDSQAKELSRISQDYQKLLFTVNQANQQIMLKAQQEGRKLNYDEYMKPMSEVTKKMEAELEELLLPHQVKRIKQLAVRQQLVVLSGYSDDLSYPLELAKPMGLSSVELKELKELVSNTRAEYEEKVKKLQDDARDKILKSLPEEKREIYLDIVGEPFDFDASQRSLRGAYNTIPTPFEEPSKAGDDAEDKKKDK